MENSSDKKRNKTGGRTKGTPNKTTAHIRETFQKVISDNTEQISLDIKNMEPKDRVKFVLELAKFVLPQLKSVELSGESSAVIRIDLGTGEKSPEE